MEGAITKSVCGPQLNKYLLEYWRKFRPGAPASLGTEENIKRIVKIWIKEIGEIYSQQIDAGHAGAIYLKRKKVVRPATLNYERQYFRAFLGWLENYGMLGMPFGKIMKAWPHEPEDGREPVILNREQVDRLVEAAEEEWLKLFILVGSRTGLRESAIRKAQLTWMAKDGTLSVPGGAQKTRKPIQVLVPPRVRELVVGGQEEQGK